MACWLARVFFVEGGRVSWRVLVNLYCHACQKCAWALEQSDRIVYNLQGLRERREVDVCTFQMQRWERDSKKSRGKKPSLVFDFVGVHRTLLVAYLPNISILSLIFRTHKSLRPPFPFYYPRDACFQSDSSKKNKEEKHDAKVVSHKTCSALKTKIQSQAGHKGSADECTPWKNSGIPGLQRISHS